jgi:hypothetical protein
MPKMETVDKVIRVTLVRSPIGYAKDQKATVRALVFAVCIKPLNIGTTRLCVG